MDWQFITGENGMKRPSIFHWPATRDFRSNTGNDSPVSACNPSITSCFDAIPGLHIHSHDTSNLS